MALTRWYTFEEGVNAAAIATGGAYIAVTAAPTYDTASAHHGGMGMLSTSGGYITLSTDAVDNGGFSVYFTMNSTTTGAPRLITFTDASNAFIGMFRPHTDGKFDIADGTSTRQAASTYTWVTGTKYRVDGFLGGSGTARTIDLKVFIGEDNASPVWTSGSVAVTSATATAWTRARVGAQGATVGTIRIDDVRFFNTQVYAGPVPQTEIETGGTGQGQVTGTAAASFTPTIATATPGSDVFLFVNWATSAATFSQTGWTQLGVLATDSTSTIGVFWKQKVTPGETTTVFTTQSGRGAWAWVAFPSLDRTAPYQTFTAAANMLKKNTASTSVPTPSVTNALATAWAVAAHALRTSTVGNKVLTFTPDAALVELQDANMSASTSSPWTAIELAMSPAAVTAAAHSYTATAAFSETHGAGVLLYVNPWQSVTATTLVVADVAQAQTISAPALTQVHQLAAAGVAQAQVISAPALTQVHALAAASIAQAQSLSVPAVTKQSDLVVAGLFQTPFIQGPVPISQIHQLTAASLAQGQALAAPALTQLHLLAAANLAQAQALSSPAITKQSTLVVAGSVQAQALSSLALTQVHQLAAAGLTQSQTLAAVALTQTHALSVAGIGQGQSLSSALLAQIHVLTVASLAQGQAIPQISLSAAGALVVAPISQAQTLSSAALAQVHQIAAQSLQQAQSLSPVSLAGGSTLVVAGTLQGQALSSPVLAQLHQLAVASLSQGQQITAPTLGQIHILTPAGIAQVQALSPVVLSTAAFLAVQGITQSQAVSSPALTQSHLLAVQALVQAQKVAGVAITGVHQLTVAGLGQVQRISLVTLSEGEIQYVYFWWDPVAQVKIPVKVRGLWTGSEIVEARVSVHNP